MPSKPVAMASDHAGLALRTALAGHLRACGYAIADLGTDGPDSVDYPDFGYALARAIRSDGCDIGILVCGTGIGISMAANRYPWIRAAVCHDVTSARLAREHNNANVIALGGRLIGEQVACECVDTFLASKFAGDRHRARVDKLSAPPDLTLYDPGSEELGNHNDAC